MSPPRLLLGVALGLCLSSCSSDDDPPRDCSISVEAARYDPARGCFERAEAVGCMAVGQDCGDAETLAIDGEGRCFRFASTCLPRTFTVAKPGDARCGAPKALVCKAPSP